MKKYRVKSFFLFNFFLIAVVFVFAQCCGSSSSSSTPTITVTISTATSAPQFSAEIADTAEERSTGLMNRTTLASDAAMLFVFDSDGRSSFWMKDTLVSLDILFINSAKIIVDLAQDTEPLSEELITPSQDYRYVLEINAGTAEAEGIAVGDEVQFTL